MTTGIHDLRTKPPGNGWGAAAAAR